MVYEHWRYPRFESVRVIQSTCQVFRMLGNIRCWCSQSNPPLYEMLPCNIFHLFRILQQKMSHLHHIHRIKFKCISLEFSCNVISLYVMEKMKNTLLNTWINDINVAVNKYSIMTDNCYCQHGGEPFPTFKKIYRMDPLKESSKNDHKPKLCLR